LTAREDAHPPDPLPPHKPHAVWRDLDPTIQLLLLKQVKGRLSEPDWLVLVREIQ
jgi:hypothetical protein